ncbi:MAG: hypothetical protein CVT67_02355 [Actinobacteria bacterium HGW-Actinobacteria-7]|jgi:hypothetical protein|nr:MAG: hypothetical protein CVT67_02355 [Actinobacteria bacterium HGW-Actinobacteria-7]
MSDKRTAREISDRKAATVIGVLYIIGTLAGIAAAVVMPSMSGPDVLANIAAHRTAAVAGTLLILTMGFALSALSAVFYPVGRRYSEVLSMGYVIFRGALEGMLYVVGALILLLLVALSATPSAASPVAAALQSAYGVIWDQLLALPFLIGASMFYWVLFRARLVPGWITVWGLVGAVLYLAAPLARMAGLNLDILMAPLALQEMVLAVWLIVKGFSPDALTSVDRQLQAAPRQLDASWVVV